MMVYIFATAAVEKAINEKGIDQATSELNIYCSKNKHTADLLIKAVSEAYILEYDVDEETLVDAGGDMYKIIQMPF